MPTPYSPKLPRRATLALVAVPWAALARERPDLVSAIHDAVGDGEAVVHGISLTMPAVAENGGQVPLTVQVDSPQTTDRYVTAIHIFATRNPTPGVASFRLTPAVARAEIQTRIRLADHQQVIAIAALNDGSLRRAVAEVRVSSGGCLT